MSMITSCNIYSFEIPTDQLHSLRTRKGFLIQVRNAMGKEGLGEISPLPGFSQENLNEVLEELKSIKISDFSQFKSRFPSAQFGVESAMHQLNEIGAQTWHDQNPPKVPQTHFLLTGDQQTMRKRLSTIVKGSMVKVKVANFTPREARELIEDILNFPKISLSLDCNEAWTREDVYLFCKAFPPFTFRYIEEPVKTLEDMHWLSKHTQQHFALDEKLRKFSLNQIMKLSNIKSWIIKPTLFGGISRCNEYARIARDCHIDVHLSSSFESSIGISQIIRLFLNNHDYQNPMGIDTLRFFKQDLLTGAISFDALGRVLPGSQIHFNQINPLAIHEKFSLFNQKSTA